jgi:hypothetical protein
MPYDLDGCVADGDSNRDGVLTALSLPPGWIAFCRIAILPFTAHPTL